MSLKALLYKYYSPWLAIPVICVFAVMLVMAVIHLVNLPKKRQLTSLMLVPEQVIEFDQAGTVLLEITGPRFKNGFAGLRFVLEAKDTRERVATSPILFPLLSQTRGAHSARTAIEKYDIPRSGQYIFYIAGLEPDRDYADHQIIFSEPYRMELVAGIVAIVITAGLTIASFVLLMIRISRAAGEP